MSPVGRSALVDDRREPRWQFLALHLPRGTGFDRHHHDEHQLVVVHTGTLGLATPNAVWAVPAGVGVWVPSGGEHELVAIDAASVTFAYLRAAPDWPAPTAGAVALTPLLRSSVDVLVSPGARRGDRRRRLEAVLFDEVTDLRPVQLLVPLPRDPIARLVAVTLLDDPLDRRTIEQLGAEVGASGRTLQRRFSEETGLGFREWRRRARLQRAMVELEAGQTVTASAYSCGFSSASAFVAAFRTAVGSTPADWARGRTGGGA